MSFFEQFFQARKERKKMKANPGRKVSCSLPHDFRIGSTIDLSETIFLIFGDQLQFDFPGPKQVVVGWSQIDISGTACYVLYLENAYDSTIASALYIFPAQDGTSTEEVFLFRNYLLPNGESAVFRPQTASDWSEWWVPSESESPEVMPKIGCRVFENCPGRNDESLSYLRYFDNEGLGWIPSMDFSERIHTSEYAGDDYCLERSVMWYFRALALQGASSQDEFLILMKNETPDDAWVEALAGVKIDLMRV